MTHHSDIGVPGPFTPPGDVCCQDAYWRLRPCIPGSSLAKIIVAASRPNASGPIAWTDGVTGIALTDGADESSTSDLPEASLPRLQHNLALAPSFFSFPREPSTSPHESRMLPNPATSRAKSRTYFSAVPASSTYSTSSTSLLNHLRARTRLTNLAVLLIGSTLCLSLVLNLQHYFSGPTSSTARRKVVDGDTWVDLATAEQLESGIPLSMETTIERDARYAQLDHMVMVPGHAIWVGHDPAKVMQDEEWILEPMQRGGSVKTFVKHIEEAAAVLRSDDSALLVFSGGATRNPPSPPMSEALSYLLLAQALPLLPATSHSETGAKGPLPLSLRAVTEEYAMDSYQNLLFAFARFHEVTGRWPAKVTVVGYGMKRRRFEQLHRHVLGFPAKSFNYIGIDDEGDTTEHYAGELKYGYTPFLSSPTGCHPPLSTKKLLRNPYHRYHPYHTSSPELADLFEWCPPFQVPNSAVDESERWKDVPVFPGSLPWREAVAEGTKWDRERD